MSEWPSALIKPLTKVLRSVIELRRVRSYEIDDVQLPLVVLTPLPLHAASRRFPFDPPGMSTCPLHFSPSSRSPEPKFYVFLPTAVAVRSLWSNITRMLQSG